MGEWQDTERKLGKQVLETKGGYNFGYIALWNDTKTYKWSYPVDF